MTGTTSTSHPALVLTSDITITRSADLVHWYGKNVRRGPDYYSHRKHVVDRDHVLFGDLAWATLLEGRPSSSAAQSLLRNVPIDIHELPDSPLHTLNDGDCTTIVGAIGELVKLAGFGSSLATKVLHPKRPASIPVLDNGAIYGAFLRPGYRPGEPTYPTGTSALAKISNALQAIRNCVRRGDNRDAWAQLEQAFPSYERIELFDMIWWAVTRANLIQVGERYEIAEANND